MPEAKLVPAKGRAVPFEDGTAWPLDAKGRPIAAVVDLTRYYRRRIRDCDLLIAADDAATAPAPDPAEVPAPAAAIADEKPAGPDPKAGTKAETKHQGASKPAKTES